MIEYVLLGGILILLLGLYVIKLKKPNNANTSIDFSPIQKQLLELPNKLLNSITSSSSNLKGALGELTILLKLQAEYDRLIPLNNIVDYIGIVLPKNGKEGKIDFIEVKTNKARLSKDQELLRQVIKDKKINFVKTVIKIETGEECNESNEIKS